MNDEQAKQTEFDPCEQALRDHADMIERSCPETPQLRRRIKRLRKAADRIQSLTAENERLREAARNVIECWDKSEREQVDGAFIDQLEQVLKEAADGE